MIQSPKILRYLQLENFNRL